MADTTDNTNTNTEQTNNNVTTEGSTEQDNNVETLGVEKEVINKVESNLKSEIESVKQQMADLVNNLSEQSKKKSTPNETSKSKQSANKSEENKDNLTLKKLQTELESLRNELKEKERKNLENERNSKIKDLFFREGIQYVDSAMNLFLSENQDKLKMENDNWYVEEGDRVYDLEDYVNQFMERPEIKSFKAKQTKGGNLKPPEKIYPSESKSKKSSLNESLFIEE